MQAILSCVNRHIHMVLVSTGPLSSVWITRAAFWVDLDQIFASVFPSLSFIFIMALTEVYTTIKMSFGLECIYIFELRYCTQRRENIDIQTKVLQFLRQYTWVEVCVYACVLCVYACVRGLRLCVWWQDCHAVITVISLSLSYSSSSFSFLSSWPVRPPLSFPFFPFTSSCFMLSRSCHLSALLPLTHTRLSSKAEIFGRFNCVLSHLLCLLISIQ